MIYAQAYAARFYVDATTKAVLMGIYIVGATLHGLLPFTFCNKLHYYASIAYARRAQST